MLEIVDAINTFPDPPPSTVVVVPPQIALIGRKSVCIVPGTTSRFQLLRLPLHEDAEVEDEKKLHTGRKHLF